MKLIAISNAWQLTERPALQLEDAALLADSPVQEHPGSVCVQTAICPVGRTDHSGWARSTPKVCVFEEPIPALFPHQSSPSYRPSSLETLA